MDRGYPQGAVLYEPSLRDEDGNYGRPDFLVVDPVRNEKLAIIEVKASTVTADAAALVLNKYRSLAGDLSLPAYVVTPEKSPSSPHSFCIQVLNEKGQLETIPPELFPAYKALSSARQAEQKQEVINKKEDTVNSFRTASWILAGCTAALAVADFVCSQYEIELITTERLALIGAAVALVVIPYAQKFKGLGIEWERAQSKED